MGENLLESYNPLYDVHLRQYFALPHMQKHLRNLGLLDGSPVQQQNELHAGHLAMMDLLLRNRERVLQQLMDLQRKLDAVEKVELYRRIRSGITNADESADRHQHMSRSLSRPARSAAARLGERRGRRQSLSPEAGELIKRVENDYRSDSAPFKNPKSIYNRLAASVYKYQYLHKLDDRTLRKYMLSLRKQLAKLERFREVSFGPHTMAKHPPLQLQQSWFFRRRSLPSLNSSNANQSRTHTQQTNAGGQRSLKSGLAPKVRSGKSQSPLKFASAIDEPPPKMQRRTSISRTRQQRLPPLPKKRSFAASRTNTLPTSKTSERLPPTATTEPIRNTPSDTRRALPPSSAQKKTPTGSRPGSKGSTTPVFVQKRSSASSGILPAIGGAAVAAAAVGLVLENGGKRAEEGQGRESVAPSPSISLAASQTTTTDGGQPGGDSESEEQLKDSAKTAPEGMNGGTETRPTPEPFLEQEIGKGNLVYEPEVRIESEERIEEQQTTPAATNDGAGMEEHQTEPFQKESSSSLEGQPLQEYSKGVAEVEASSPEESWEEGIKELETRSNHTQEQIGAVEEASPEEWVEEVESRSLEHPEERVEEVETRSLEHPEERVEEVETRSLEHPEERVEEVETRSYGQKELLTEDERVGKPTGEQPDEFVWEGADYAAEERDELPKDNACPPEGCRLQRDDLVENEEVLKSEEDPGRKLSKTENLAREMEQKIVMAENEGLDEHEGSPERLILLGNEDNLPKSEDRTEGAPNEGRLSQKQVDNESLETWMKPEEEEDALNYYEKPKWTPRVDEDADNEQGKAGNGRDESETGQGRRLSQNSIVEDQIGTGTSLHSQREDEEQFGREEMAATDLKGSIHHHSAENGAYPQQSDNGTRPATAEAIRQGFEEPIGVSLLSQPSIEITPAFEYGGSVEGNLASPQVHSVAKSFEKEVLHSPHEMSENLEQLIRGDMADEQATNLEEENDSLPMNVAAGHNHHPPINGKGENEMVGERVNGEAKNWSDVSGRGGEVEGDSEECPLLLLKEEAHQRGKKSNGQLPDVGREEGETSSDDTEGADDGESDGSVVIRHQQRSDEEQPQLQSFKLEAEKGSE